MPTSTLAQATLAEANKANRVAKADYEILVELLHRDDVVPHIPDPLDFGKTVHYKTNSRTGQNADLVEIEFHNGSPYLNLDGSPKMTVTSQDLPLQLEVKGIFFARCYITHNGVRYGWSLAYPGAGGNHVVQ
jgi:hypothetical protein